MLRQQTLFFLLAFCAAWLGCATEEVQAPRTDRASIFEASELITYEYSFAEANPESLLKVLIRARIPVVVAWEPLDNACMDPLGPRFTVGLTRDDPRMAEFNFRHGNGRLACSQRIRKYVI